MALYPPEILNYAIRANGYTVKQYCNALPALVLIYLMPIGLANIGWRMYIVNASWNIITFFLILRYWVETKGLSLEEIVEIFEGKKPEHVHMGADTTIGRLEMDKSGKDSEHNVTVLEQKESRI